MAEDSIANFQDHGDIENIGIPDWGVIDNDNNDILDNFEGDGLIDTDNNSISDNLYLDSDNNSVFDVLESGCGDADTEGIGSSNLWLLVLLAPFICIARRSSKMGLLLVLVILPIISSADPGQKKNITDELLSSLYIGGGVGASLITPETSGTNFSVIENQDLGYKFYLGLDLTESISAELSMADLGTAQLDPDGEISYFISSFSGLYYFYDQGENDHKGWATFIKGGIGAIRNNATVLYQKENPVQISLGGGIEYAWHNGLAARVELESFDEDSSLITVGLLYRFGKKSDKKSRPGDSDKDGVLNGVDLCPESPSAILVDESGCNIDSDGDGVLNILDQCPETYAGIQVDENGCNSNTDTDRDGVINKLD